jgi:hypothetical protein
VVGDGKPAVHIPYRAVVPTPEWPKEYRINRMVLWAGEKTHLVHYPLRRGRNEEERIKRKSLDSASKELKLLENSSAHDAPEMLPSEGSTLSS